jgi:hypothetical protein
MVIKTEFGKAYISSKGYYMIYSNELNNKGKLLHRLVYEKFIGIIPDNYDIHHIDGNRLNNEIYNLQCLSHSEHIKLHAVDREFSDETRKNLSLALTGKKLTKEQRKNISEGKKGIRFTDEHRKNLSEARIGLKDSEETKNKKSQNTKGENNPATNLTNKDVQLIKRMLLTGKLTQKRIGEFFGVSNYVINKINTGRHWSHIKIERFYEGFDDV